MGSRKSRLREGGESAQLMRRKPRPMYHSTKVAARIAERSLMSQAAGRPVARVRRPQRRKVQATLFSKKRSAELCACQDEETGPHPRR
jgi:hypothetical protein